MRDGKNFRRWFRLRGHKPNMVSGITAELIDLPLVMAIMAKALKPVPSIYEGGIAHGSKLALIGDEPDRKEYVNSYGPLSKDEQGRYLHLPMTCYDINTTL